MATSLLPIVLLGGAALYFIKKGGDASDVRTPAASGVSSGGRFKWEVDYDPDTQCWLYSARESGEYKGGQIHFPQDCIGSKEEAVSRAIATVEWLEAGGS